MDKQEFKRRQKNLRSSLCLMRREAFLVTKSVNIRYLTGFHGEDSALLITSSGHFLLTDFRYEEELRTEFKGLSLELRKQGETLFASLGRLFLRKKLRSLFFESGAVSHFGYVMLKRLLAGRKIQARVGIVENLRCVKSPSEIALIRKSVRIAESVLKKVIRKARPGVREIDLAVEAEYLMKKLGGECAAFPPIVASGSRTSRPHARPTAKRIPRKGILLFDLGVKREGYHSDLTRTFFLGKITAKFERLYYLLKESQDTAIRHIKAGATIGEIDEACRSFLKRHKLARFFGHSLGHGVGLEVHENPTIFYTNKKPLLENMVLTVEPGIYIPGWGGIRLEDMVRVTSSGCEVLTTVTREPSKFIS